MASLSWCLYAAASLARCSPLQSPTRPQSVCRCSCILLPRPTLPRRSRVRRNAVVCMAPEEEKMTRHSPLDFPIGSFPYMSPEKLAREWWLLVEEERYKDPPEEDEKEEEEEDPEKPEMSRMQRGA
ncbi:hypothetical protein C4D60_Mb06t30400 [Musa balbisiana]|uniref:Uncharacterized protein n=1 Tax=Musa balbisiana TaxID=52838 RepID=A0A4S8IRS2_MUSBA|nr:hypothetical protein C4D60_Mb06t30400 [Musa balbisiana]